MNHAHTRRGLSLIETVSVIVIIAAIAPVLAHLLSTTSASHSASSKAREEMGDVRFATETAEARVRARLEDPAITITKAGTQGIAFSDGTILEFFGGDVTWTDHTLPRAALATGVEEFSITYLDITGAPLDTTDAGFDESDVSRVVLEITLNGVTRTSSIYREGTREYTPPPASEGAVWHEDFDDVSNGATSDEGETAWTTQLNGHTQATHGVLNDRYDFSAMSPSATPVVWRSETIDTSAMDEFVLSMVIDGSGSLDSSGGYRDFLEVGLTIDGVRTTVFAAEGSAGEDVSFLSSGFNGDETIIDVAAFLSGSDEHYTIDDVRLGAPYSPSGVLSLGSQTILSYDPNSQDGSGRRPTSYEFLENGTVLRITGNAWKAIAISYTITRDTVIRFDFRSDDIGEINGLMFDDNLKLNGANDTRNIIKVTGTQRITTIQTPAIDAYDLSGNWQTFRVPIGTLASASLIGETGYLVFVSDEDRTGESVGDYRNISIFEEVPE